MLFEIRKCKIGLKYFGSWLRKQHEFDLKSQVWVQTKIERSELILILVTFEIIFCEQRIFFNVMFFDVWTNESSQNFKDINLGLPVDKEKIAQDWASFVVIWLAAESAIDHKRLANSFFCVSFWMKLWIFEREVYLVLFLNNLRRASFVKMATVSGESLAGFFLCCT